MPGRRTPSTEAVKIVLGLLRQNESSPMTIQEISRRAGLNRRTVEKAIDVLKFVNENMANAELVAFRSGGSNFVEVKPSRVRHEIGLLDLPSNVQRLVVRAAYFPTPSEEETILVHLLLRGATEQTLATPLEKSPTVLALLKQENILKTASGFFLSEIGRNVAQGALSLYPELANIVRQNIEEKPSQSELWRRYQEVLNQLAKLQTSEAALPNVPREKQ